MPGDADQDPFARLAGRIVKNTTRPVFQVLFDRTMAPLIDKGVEKATSFIALSTLRNKRRRLEPGVDKDIADIASALDRANDLGVLGAFMANNFESLFGLVTDGGTGTSSADLYVDLQAIANVSELFRNPRAATSGGAAAQRRCCRITCEIDGQQPEKGSGFLIGPHLVLTNFHVVRSQIGADGRPREGSRLRMTVTFDALGDPATANRTYHPTEQWLLDSSPTHPHDTVMTAAPLLSAPEGNGAGASAMPLERWPTNPDILVDYLDFAIIELDATPGYERGWYSIDARRWPKGNTSATVYQFPSGLAMAYAAGQFLPPPPGTTQLVFSTPNTPPRILHNANTISGSSGGVCLDSGMEALALHQASCRFRTGRDHDGNPAEIGTLNVAIPLTLIAQKSGNLVRDSIAAAPTVENWTGQKQPIIGRRTLQSLATSTACGVNRIIVVQTSLDPLTRSPRTKIGKSFSQTILERFLPAGEHKLLPVRGVRLSSDAYDVARVIMAAVDPTREGTLPTPADRETSLDADAKARLVDPLIAAMRRAAGSGVFWLVIDDLDRYPINASSTAATLLDAIYAAVSIEDQLRILLIGPTSKPGALATLPVQYEPVLEDHVSDTDIADWIAVEYGRDRQLTAETIQLMVDIARSFSKVAAENPATGPTAAIAAVLRDHLAPCMPARAY